MQLSPVERLILLKITQILEIVDPANAGAHDADAQALELGTRKDLAGVFDQIELEPVEREPSRPLLRLVAASE